MTWHLARVEQTTLYLADMRLSSLTHAIESVIRSSDGSRHQLVAPLVELLRDQNRHDLARCLIERTYVHANGFSRLLLLSYAESAFELALHSWPATSAAAASRLSLHTHAAPYESWVIAGALTEELFHEDASGRGFTAGAFRSVPRGGTKARPLPYLKDVSLVPTDRHTYGAGAYYQRQAHEIHNAYSTHAGTLSLCLSGPKIHTATVFRRGTARAMYRSPKTPPLNEAAVAHMLTSLLQ